MTDKAETVSDEKKLRTVTAKVVSNKMDKTISVSVERKVKHPLYGKYMRKSTKFMVHEPPSKPSASALSDVKKLGAICYCNPRKAASG